MPENEDFTCTCAKGYFNVAASPGHFLRELMLCVPAVLHAQADTRRVSGLCCGHVVVLRRLPSVVVRRLRGDIGHAENTRLHVETLRHLGAGVLHGYNGDLTHLVGAARDLSAGIQKATFVSRPCFISSRGGSASNSRMTLSKREQSTSRLRAV